MKSIADLVVDLKQQQLLKEKEEMRKEAEELQIQDTASHIVDQVLQKIVRVYVLPYISRSALAGLRRGLDQKFWLTRDKNLWLKSFKIPRGDFDGNYRKLSNCIAARLTEGIVQILEENIYPALSEHKISIEKVTTFFDQSSEESEGDEEDEEDTQFAHFNLYYGTN